MLAEMIFQPKKALVPTPDTKGLQAEDVWLQPGEGPKIHGWWFEAEACDEAILFLHGSAGNIAGRLDHVAGWLERGISVFLLDWRGFGQSEGEITGEQDVYADASAALDWLKQNHRCPEDIWIWGESFGATAAVELATREKTGGVVLEAPFESLPSILTDLIEADFPGVNEVLFERFVFDNLSRIAKIKSPLMILHGAKDEVCSADRIQKLYEAAPTPKTLWILPEGDHDHLKEIAGPAYWDNPVEWLRAQ